MVEPGRLGARQGRVPVPHSTAPITLGGCPRGVAGMGPGLTRAGGGGGGGESRRGPPAPPLGGRPGFPNPGPPLVVGALTPGVRVRSGSWGRPGGGGAEGLPVDRSSGGPFRPEPPPLPSPSGQWSWRGSWGARLPYCSGAPPCAPPRLGPRAALARWCRLARRPRPPREQAARGAGARGVQVQPHRPPRVAVPSGGGGGVPSAPGGQRAAPVALKVGGEPGGGGWGAAPPPPAPLPRCLRRAPPGYTRAVGVAGRPRASGAARSAANGTVGRGGGGPPALVCAPTFPLAASEGAAPFAPSWAPPVRRRWAAGRAGACGRFTRGAFRGRGAPSPRVQRPLLGGVRGHRLFGLPPSALGPEGEGGQSGVGPLVPWHCPLTAGGVRPGGPGPRGQPSAWGLHSSPAPFYLEPDPRAGPRWGPLSPPPSPRGAGRPGASVRVSGQRLVGCGAVGSPPRSLSPPSLPREVARAPSSGRIVGGAWVGRPSSPPHSLASAVWAVTCAVACVGAGAVAVAGCAGGSASGRGRCARPGGASCWRPRP